ncbi:MAG: ATP-binding protein [Pseudomonadota bacterium]
MAESQFFKTEIDATLSAVGELLDSMAPRLSELSLGQSTAHAVMLCVEEIAANSVNYGGIHGQHRALAVTLARVPEAVIARVSYPGPRFDPIAEAPAGQPGFDQVGGRGLYLVQQLASAVAYTHQAGHNTVTIRIAHRPL